MTDLTTTAVTVEQVEGWLAEGEVCPNPGVHLPPGYPECPTCKGIGKRLHRVAIPLDPQPDTDMGYTGTRKEDDGPLEFIFEKCCRNCGHTSAEKVINAPLQLGVRYAVAEEWRPYIDGVDKTTLRFELIEEDDTAETPLREWPAGVEFPHENEGRLLPPETMPRELASACSTYILAHDTDGCETVNGLVCVVCLAEVGQA